jgi:hypothetical protein
MYTPSLLACLRSCQKDNSKMASLREMARANAELIPLAATFFQACPEHPDASCTTRFCSLIRTVCAGKQAALPSLHFRQPGRPQGNPIQVRVPRTVRDQTRFRTDAV